MNEAQSKALLDKYLVSGKKAAKWLERSYIRCQAITLSEAPSDEAFDEFENLTSRFARLSDILLQKVFRLIDQVLLETPGSIIDIINRAEKRGICEASRMRGIRELRNAIAHEYTEEDLIALFSEVQTRTSELLLIFRQTEDFVRDKGLQ